MGFRPLKGIGVRGYIENYIKILGKLVAQICCSIWPQIKNGIHGKICIELTKKSRGRQRTSESFFQNIQEHLVIKN